jgi:hypothetical protein
MPPDPVTPTAAPLPAPGALRLREGMSFDAWLAVGRRIARVANTSAWAVGDWLVFGERSYGERYRTALAATDLDYQTLRNYAWVARRFPVSRRRDTVSFQHHAEVASLTDPEQDLWLRRTEVNGWSRNELRRRLSAARAPAVPAPDRVVRMSVAATREQHWRRAAGRANLTLQQWLRTVADAAAEQRDLP